MGKVQGEPDAKFMDLFEKVKVTFENTQAYMPVEWLRSRRSLG